MRAKTLLSNGTRTDTYLVDYVDRASTRRDAVAVAIYARSPNDTTKAFVLLRRQLRYPVYLVEDRALHTEVVAGIIEKPETPEEATLREVHEETGLVTEASRVRRLGSPVFASPGTFTERFQPMSVELTLDALHGALSLQPEGDGSPMEEGASHFVVALDTALAAIWSQPPDGHEALAIRDAKTEIVLLRLRDWLGQERRDR